MLGALIVMDCSTAAVTVIVIEFDVTPPCAAVILAEPTLFPVARPDALTVATAEFEEDQVTELIRFCVLPSVKVPVAVNCCEAPTEIVELAGVTAIEFNAEGIWNATSTQ